jgi:predicted KAP-like P-loop ATPase
VTDPPDRASPDRVGTPASAEVGQPEAAVLETVDASGAGASWRSDNPLSNPADDLLGRAPFAKGVAAAIRGRQDPSSIVVGLYGPWGDGKSTVLNFVEAALDGSDVVVVPFNPWLISDETELLPAFFTEVARELDVRLGGTKRRVGDALRKVGGFLSPLSVSTEVAGASPGSLVGYLADQVAGTSLVALRQDFEKALEEAGKRVVVTVDDLDRLDDREIRSMFRLIRLAAPFDRLTYVVACDETVVANALSQMQGSTATTGLAYLEKIVQVPLHIPPAPEPALTEGL